MIVKEIMDKEIIDISPEMSLVDVSKKMEKYKKFAMPVVDNEKKLIGWITSFDVSIGFREGYKKASEIMRPKEEVVYVHENEAARLAILKLSKYKVVSMPVLDDNEIVVGVIRTFDVIDTLSQLYEVKVYKIYEAMAEELKGVSWDELMEAAAIITRRRTGKRIKPEQYEKMIRESTFGEAIWETGGLEKFFVALIAMGELVIARKVARARK